MRKLLKYGAMAAVAGVLTGCEWTGSSDGDSWNTQYNWVNFGGVYRPAAGNTFLVSLHAPLPSSPSSVENASQAIGTGNGLVTAFSSTLGNTPVVLGSVKVTDGAETFLENPAGSGQLQGSLGGVGSINYQTGGINVNFAFAPAAVSIIVTHQYAKSGTPASPAAGSSAEIYTMSVDQVGNKLVMVDNLGRSYDGQLTSVSGTGGDFIGTTSGEIVANFVASGNGVKMTGTFTAAYSAGDTIPQGGREPGTLANRTMRGTWIESGVTGDIVGGAGSVVVSAP